MTRAIVLVAVLLMAACGPLPTGMEIDGPIVGTWVHLSDQVNDRFYFSVDGQWTRSRVAFRGLAPLTFQEPDGNFTSPEPRELSEFWMGRYRLADGRVTLNVDWYQIGHNTTKVSGADPATLTCTFRDNLIFLDAVEYRRVNSI